jgi:N-methylhydantoinase A
VDLDAAESALKTLGLRSAEAAARGVIEVANAVMARAIRAVSIERGHDPEEFTLVAFGGAGPLHACELAEALRIPRVLVPPHPGLMSAAGMTETDTTRDYAMPLMMRHTEEEDPRELTPVLLDKQMALSARADHELHHRPGPDYSVDMRYAGQGHELNVAWNGRAAGDLLEAFHNLHQQRYGHSDRARTVELVTLRLRARVPREPAPRPTQAAGSANPAAAKAGSRQVMLDRPRDVPLFSRDRLLAGNTIAGPAIVEQLDSTTLILPGWMAIVDASGALILTRGRHGN